MTATADDRSLNGNHTFSCALRTRGGVCDCWSVPQHSVAAGLADPTPMTDVSLAPGNVQNPLGEVGQA